MNVEIVMIGTELLLGQIVDTNATYIAEVLATNGIPLYRKTTVGDNRMRIIRTLHTALSRSDVVLTSGGLGPTVDDITRECVAEIAGQPLEMREELRAQLLDRFARFRRPVTENNMRQAYAPKEAIAITNPNGTAPGLIVETDRGIIICMPGVPHELRPMLTNDVIPYIRKRYHMSGLVQYRNLLVCGMGESSVDAAIADLIEQGNNPKIGLLASPDAVRIRISAFAHDLEMANEMLDETEAHIRQRLPGRIMGKDTDTLENAVDQILREKGWTLSIGETYTGGMIARRLVSSQSAPFLGSIVTPPGQINKNDLHDTALTLCTQLREQFKTDCVLALAASVEENLACGYFECPEGVHSWRTGFVQTDELGQSRGATFALEQVRRILSGEDIQTG